MVEELTGQETTISLRMAVRKNMRDGERYTELRCEDGHHYKSYTIILEQSTLSDKWVIICFWGRIGQRVQSQVKLSTMNKHQAFSKFMEWEQKKLKPHGTGQYYVYERFEGKGINEKYDTMVSALEISEALQDQKAIFETKHGDTLVHFLEV